MGNMEQHLEDAGSATSLLYQLSDLWGSPRGTVLRIQTLALVAIALSFLLAVFGSCRRWSNNWIVQKGFLVAQVLSLSLGTYSIGLMQSSWVKSEMYPIWAVSLLTLFGCVDPVTTYIGLDYRGPLWKVIFQLCLYCGYVLLMSVSSISGVFGNIAIGVLSATTFIKGFHRSLALVLPSRTRNKLVKLDSIEPGALLAGHGEELQVHLPFRLSVIEGKEIKGWVSKTSMADIYSSCNKTLDKLKLKETTANGMTIEDVCLGYSLSHLLQRRFLGLDTAQEMEKKREKFEELIQDCEAAHAEIAYKRTLKAIEAELGFLYEVFFTSNEFLHYYEAKTSSFWALASFMGICLVGVAAAIPGTMASHHRITYTGTGAVTVVVNTTTADLVITLVIIMCMALLQLVQLIGCWTSNWAKVAFACKCKYYVEKPSSQRIEYTATNKRGKTKLQYVNSESDLVRVSPLWRQWMKLKAFAVTRIRWVDMYLWQDKLGQYSVVAAKSWREERCMECLRIIERLWIMLPYKCQYWIRDRLPGMLGLQYILQALEELWGSDTKGGAGVRLDDDVKTSITAFLSGIKNRKIGGWSSSFVDNGLCASYLPYSSERPPPLAKQKQGTTMSDAYAFTHRVMVWHIATWYCGQAEQAGRSGEGNDTTSTDRRVAMVLSKYCAYLVVSAPELLQGPSGETKRAFRRVVWCTGEAIKQARNGLAAMLGEPVDYKKKMEENNAFWTGVYWGKHLCDERPPPPECTRRCSDNHWKVLKLLWVQTLVYAAPYGNVEAHKQHLSKGGEFITHLWTLLYHIGIDKWE